MVDMEDFLLNYQEMYASGPLSWPVNNGLCIACVPLDIRPLSEPMFTKLLTLEDFELSRTKRFIIDDGVCITKRSFLCL